MINMLLSASLLFFTVSTGVPDRSLENSIKTTAHSGKYSKAACIFPGLEPVGQDEKFTGKGELEIDGFRLGYSIEGEGIPCLVIGSSVYYPKTFSENLRKHLKMYFVDMPWFAMERDKTPADSFSTSKINGFIEAIRKQLGLDQPVIIGHSIHGTVAMEYAKRHPENSRGLVLIGSPNIYGNETYTRLQSKAWERASAARKERQHKNWVELAGIKDGFSPAQLIVEEYCTMAPTYWNDPLYDARWLWEGMIIQPDLLHNLYDRIYQDYFMFNGTEEAPVPTLVFLGRQDFAIPPELWEKDKNTRNLTWVVLEKSGHTPQLEESRTFDRILLDWIGKNVQ